MLDDVIRISVSVDKSTVEVLNALRKLCEKQGVKYGASEAIRRALAYAYSERPGMLTEDSPLEICKRMQLATIKITQLAESLSANTSNTKWRKRWYH